MDDASKAELPTEELILIHEIASAASSSLQIEEVCERLATEMKKLVDFDGGFVAVVDNDLAKATCAYTTHPEMPLFKRGTSWTLNGANAEWLLSRQSLTGADLAPGRAFEGDEQLLDAGARSILRVPFLFNERPLGILTLWSRAPEAFGAREERVLLQLAAQTAPAIENARLHDGVQRSLDILQSTHDRLVKEERLRAIGQLASGVAHDFNNALAAILGRTQLLKTQVASEDVLSSLRLIERAALDSAEVVRRILDFAKLDSETDFSSVDANRLIDEVIELTRHKWSDEAQSRGQSIRINSHRAEVPPALGSYSELREVLTNLVINACEAILGDGTIEIVTAASDGHVRISVSDTGVGMSFETMERVFDPFFTTKGASGTGLGLSVVHGIMSRHNGAVDVDSQEGVGTTITVSLPIGTATPAPDDQDPADGYAQSTRAADILVIEDEPLIAEMMQDVLSLEGHQVTLAGTGQEGLRLFEAGGHDIVFTDLGMPGLTGWEVARAIKSRRPDVPVIMVTGWGAGIEPSEIESNRVDGILPKPFDIDRLLGLVRNLMEASESRNAAVAGASS